MATTLGRQVAAAGAPGCARADGGQDGQTLSPACVGAKTGLALPAGFAPQAAHPLLASPNAHPRPPTHLSEQEHKHQDAQEGVRGVKIGDGGGQLERVGAHRRGQAQHGQRPRQQLQGDVIGLLRGAVVQAGRGRPVGQHRLTHQQGEGQHHEQGVPVEHRARVVAAALQGLWAQGHAAQRSKHPPQHQHQAQRLRQADARGCQQPRPGGGNAPPGRAGAEPIHCPPSLLRHHCNPCWEITCVQGFDWDSRGGHRG